MSVLIDRRDLPSGQQLHTTQPDHTSSPTSSHLFTINSEVSFDDLFISALQNEHNRYTGAECDGETHLQVDTPNDLAWSPATASRPPSKLFPRPKSSCGVASRKEKAREAKKRRRQKKKEGKEIDLSEYSHRPSQSAKYPLGDILKTTFNVANLPATRPGWTGMQETAATKLKRVEEYLAEGYELRDWDGR